MHDDIAGFGKAFRQPRVHLPHMLVALGVLGGCTGTNGTVQPGPPGPPGPTPALHFDGRLDVGNRRWPVRAMITRIDAELGIELEGPYEYPARGSGRVEASRFEAHLRYGEECPGTIDLKGQVLAQGLRLVGTASISDCTGTVTGTFELQTPSTALTPLSGAG